MPLVNRPSRQPSFEELTDRTIEIGEALVRQLEEAEARVKDGTDPLPPYEEADHIISHELDKKEEK